VGEPLRTVETADGRTLAYALWGDPDGFPVLTLHGTPGCRLERWPHEQLYVDLGVRIVRHDRAGYGRSTRRSGRRVVDEVDDVVALADELGLERFAVSGGSGGGPHVLACAALLPERVIRATCAVGAAPFGAPGLEPDDWLAGMDPENVKEFLWAEAGEEVLTRELESYYASILERVADDPSRLLESFELSDADREQTKREEWMQTTREAVPEYCVQGVGGWVDDDLAFLRPWGSRSSRSRCRCSSATARPTYSSRPRTANGSRRTFPAAWSRSSMPRATWARIRSRRSRRTCAGCETASRRPIAAA
jgi:pimeloyl-ACP methyl ester carboxylesterase